jgi:uncharacterized membrane protein YkoI
MIIFVSVVISHGQERPQGITLSDAISIATKMIPGEVIRTERERGLYEIKIRTAVGRIEKVYCDEMTGKLAVKDNISLDEATVIASRAVPGAVIKVEFKKGNFEVKIRTANGLRQEVSVDGRNGEILKIKRD